MQSVAMTLHFDGACTVNPGGVMSFGWHLDTADGRRVAEGSGPIHGYPPEERSCNTAEFEAALAGLEWVSQFRLLPVDSLLVVGDSQLAINILAGTWKAKKSHLRTLAERCRLAVAEIDVGHLEFKWVPRERNGEADRLSKRTP